MVSFAMTSKDAAISVLFLVSLVVCTRAFENWRKSGSWLPFHVSQTTPANILPLLCVTAWIGLTLLAKTLVTDAPTPRIGVPELLDLVTDRLLVTGFFLVVIVATSRAPLREYGLRFRNFTAQIALGLYAFLVSFLPTILIIQFANRRGWATQERQHPLLQAIQADNSTGFVALAFLLAAVLTPLFEELLFRSILQGSLSRYLRPHVVVPLVAIVFASVHNWPDSLSLIPFSLILGYLYDRQQSLLAVVSAHAFFNATFLSLTLLGE